MLGSGSVTNSFLPLLPHPGTLVVSRVAAAGSPESLDTLPEFYHLCIYTADAPLSPDSDKLQVPANRGHEAIAYLAFVMDNDAHIPTAGAVFVHGSR